MKPAVIAPGKTSRAAAFELWMDAPNPMVTFFKTLDVTPVCKYSRKTKRKFNMLLCWCIGKAASEIREFYTLPVGRELLQYDSLAQFEKDSQRSFPDDADAVFPVPSYADGRGARGPVPAKNAGDDRKYLCLRRRGNFENLKRRTF